MGSDYAETLCYVLSIDTLVILHKNIQINHCLYDKKKLSKFLTSLLKMKPMLKIDEKSNNKNRKVLKQYSAYIHTIIIRSLLRWCRTSSKMTVSQFIKRQIMQLVKKFSIHMKSIKSLSEKKAIRKFIENTKKKVKKIQSSKMIEDESSGSDVESVSSEESQESQESHLSCEKSSKKHKDNKSVQKTKKGSDDVSDDKNGFKGKKEKKSKKDTKMNKKVTKPYKKNRDDDKMTSEDHDIEDKILCSKTKSNSKLDDVDQFYLTGYSSNTEESQESDSDSSYKENSSDEDSESDEDVSNTSSDEDYDSDDESDDESDDDSHESDESESYEFDNYEDTDDSDYVLGSDDTDDESDDESDDDDENFSEDSTYSSDENIEVRKKKKNKVLQKKTKQSQKSTAKHVKNLKNLKNHKNRKAKKVKELRKHNKKSSKRSREREDKNKKMKQYLNKFSVMSETLEEGPSVWLRHFKKMDDMEKDEVMEGLQKFIKGDHHKPLIYKIMLSNIPEETKHDVITRAYHNHQEDSSKFKEWLDAVLMIPFGKYVETKVNANSSPARIKSYMLEAQDCLDEAVHGHGEAKQKIMQFIAQTVTNKSPHGLVLGIEGPMGNGKTTLIEKGFAKAMNRPFITIPLGGIQDGSFLEGHGYTYEGSRWGAIVNSLIKTKCMNPIIYMDELDKVSQTAHGHEIINLLIHLVDPAQNNHFRDKYFTGIDFDLSQATFIFSYNDSFQINPVLMDRITHLKTKGFRLPEKIIIGQKYLFPNILKDVGVSDTELNISNETLDWIIQTYTNEGGVRELKKILYDIVREINLRRMTTRTIKYPMSVSQSELENDYLKKKNQIKHDKIHKKPTVGKINGLYATCNDTGGIIVIEATWVPCDSRLKLELTGKQGEVMRESMQVAKTLSWKLLPQESKNALNDEWKQTNIYQGVHVHCPEGGVPKDGPSAGAAITVAMYSLFAGKPIRNDIAITGEIDLSGKVLEIGGLESKIFGAKNAGCKLVLCPKGNQRDLEKIQEMYGDTLFTKNKFEVKTVNTIEDVLKEMFNEKEPPKKVSTKSTKSSKSQQNGENKP